MSGTVSTIQQYYTNILQRPADSAGLNYWTNQVASGVSLSSVETAIATSSEATTFVDPILQLYQGILGRAADAAGLAYWTHQYESGAQTLAQIAADFVSSSEGEALLGTTVTSAAVETLYADSLGRSADATEVAYWVNSGLSLSDVAYQIAESPEATAHQAATSLNYLLNAGVGVYNTSGNVINLNGSALTYTGTSGNDTFNATTGANLTTGVTLNGNGGTDSLVITNFASATGAYYQGVPLGNLGIGAGQTIAPTLNGISSVEIAASPSQTGAIDLSLSTGVQSVELANSSGHLVTGGDVEDAVIGGLDVTTQFAIYNASQVTTATLDNSSFADFGVEGGVNGTPITTTNITDSTSSALAVTGLSATATETSNITDSKGSQLFLGSNGNTDGEPGEDGSLAAPVVTLNVSASDDSSAFLDSSNGAQLTTLNLNLASGASATAANPDLFGLTEYEPFVATTGLANFNITSTGSEAVGGGGDLGAAQNVAVTAGSGSLAIGEVFTALNTFSSTGYAGNLQGGVADPTLAAAIGSTLPAGYAGIAADNAGLFVDSDKLTSIATGSGTSVVDLIGSTLTNVTYTGGAGDDIVFLGDPSSTTKGATFDGGAGTNVIGLTNGSLTTTGGNTFKNFSTLEIGPATGGGAAGTFDLSDFGAALATIAITGSDANAGSETALGGNVALNNAPDNVTVVETAASGTALDSGSNSLTVQLGTVTPSGGTYSHTASFVLNADGSASDTATTATGVVNTGDLDVTANPNDSASFVPGSYNETINIASNIANPTSGTADNVYLNTTGAVNAAQATALNITNQASLGIDSLTAPALQSLTIGGGSGNVSIGGNIEAAKLTSVNAGTSTGDVSLTLNDNGTPADALFTGLTYTGAGGVDTVAVGGLGGDTFTGNGGNDMFDVTAHDGSVGTGGTSNEQADDFVYKAATDANVSDNTNPNGIFLSDLGGTLSIETINGFDQSFGTDGHDTIDLSGFAGNGSAAVLYSTAVGSGPITNTTDLTNVSNLFTAQAGGGTGVYDPTSQGGGTLYGAFVYQESATDVVVFVAAGSGTSSFAAGSDLAINLTNAGGLSAATVAHDLKFA